MIDEIYKSKILHGKPRCTSENNIRNPTEMWHEDVG
jgi:hypothetical protein